MIIVVILSILFSTKVNANSNISFIVEDIKNVEKSSTITAIIKGENLENSTEKLSGLKFDLYYDNEQLEYVSSKKGDAVSNVFDLSENYSDESRVRVGMITLSSLDKSGVFYEVTFKVKDTLKEETGTFRIDIKEASTADGNQLNVETQNGTITYIGNFINENKSEQKNEQNMPNQQNKETDNNSSNQEDASNDNENQENLNNDNKSDKNVIDESSNTVEIKEDMTNIIVTAENGSEEINLVVNSSQADEQTSIADTKNNNIYYIIIVIIVILVIVGVIIIKNKKEGK